MALFPHLLQPVLWERTGNIPPLVRLLQAYLERGANTIASAAADKIVSSIDLVTVYASRHVDLRLKNYEELSPSVNSWICAESVLILLMVLT